jgi:hypothetical protein
MNRNLDATGVALSPELPVHGSKSRTTGVYDLRITGGPSPKDTAQDDKSYRVRLPDLERLTGANDSSVALRTLVP